MPHSSNGKHRRIAIEEPQDGSLVQKAEQAGERFEAVMGEVHEVVMAKSSAFIREHPGASLLLAATV
jgi:hypothetical protein